MLAEFQRAHELLDSAVRMVRELGLATIANSLSQVGYLIALREGDITAAESALRADDAMLEQLGEHSVRSTILAMLAHVQVALGQLDDAEHYIAAAREFTDSDDLFSNVLWRCAHAKVLARRGQHKAAEERAREAESLAADSDWLCLHGDALLDLADVLRCAGEDPGARNAADAAHRLYQRKGDLASADRAAAFIRKVADPIQ
jgi:ATP/maltotriose-dependent transcriptional regulator MalT